MNSLSIIEEYQNRIKEYQENELIYQQKIDNFIEERDRLQDLLKKMKDYKQNNENLWDPPSDLLIDIKR